MDFYEHTHSFSRKGCIVGARFVTYSILEHWFVCNECGGNVLHKQRSVEGTWHDWAECVSCGERDFISEQRYLQQCAEYWEILDKLPPELRALFPEKRELDVTSEQAIEYLYGL